MQSAIENPPNRYSPPAPNLARHSPHSTAMRSISARAPADGSREILARKFIGSSRRRSANPPCISYATLRAKARAPASAGHSCAAGNHSASASQIASDSQITSSPSTSTGTFAVGDAARNLSFVSARSRRIFRSRNGYPVARSASHGRKLHDDKFMSPITISSSADCGRTSRMPHHNRIKGPRATPRTLSGGH
jgi:hypothetical protein